MGEEGTGAADASGVEQGIAGVGAGDTAGVDDADAGADDGASAVNGAGAGAAPAGGMLLVS